MRYYLDFGATNGNLTPPVLAWFRDAATHADLAKPTVFAEAAPSWLYYFDFTFPPGTSPTTTAIDYGVLLNGVGLSDVISNAPVGPTQAQPLSSTGAGGPQTLLQLRNKVRQESDTENDPHIGDPELTDYVNASRFRLYDKLITAFGDDYYNAQVTFTTDGSAQQFPLPDGSLYGGALPFYKSQLLELIGGGGGANPQAPITLLKFNLREKNRFNQPLVYVGGPAFFPRYRIMDKYVVFSRVPAPGLICQLWYAPRQPLLVQDTDVADDWSGWLEYVVVDVAIKVKDKQERDCSVLMARKAELDLKLDQAIANRDLGEPNTVQMSEPDNGGLFGGGWPGGGGFGGYY